MSIYKQPSSDCWYVNISVPGHPRIRRSTGTTDKQQAQEYHDRLKASLWRQSRLGEKQDRTWDEAVIRYLNEKAHKRTLEHDKAMLRWASPYLKGKLLSGITSDIIELLIEKRRTGSRKESVSNATINRHMDAIKRVMNCAKDAWGWIDTVPNFRTLPEPEGRLRWLTAEEATRLLGELPSHLRDMAEFTLAVGLRENNVLGLEWSQVDLTRKVAWIHPDQLKGKAGHSRRLSIPLTDEAVSIIRRQIGKHKTFIFTYAGNPIAKASSNAWYRAMQKAGIEGFTWHGLRHTWASWHVMNGTPLEVLQKLGGWATFDMVLKYAHLSPGHVAQYAINAKPVSIYCHTEN